ncbi:hypothetical protein CFC21_049084 [Triticum aestivum]|nr:cold shock protein CS66-like [Aegilops tauschii subsp. strangulata]XP_044358832.1 cold shock protein CS66-like [Triticum aestivum]AMQ77831.1 dehydrin [Triticum aestivum]KAF7038997.1 hypothetical protein CFC21_049080 [Triticum aestivum]KAF7039002.1 hypothetical protein CFC21_049084 [Triticum aestivum]
MEFQGQQGNRVDQHGNPVAAAPGATAVTGAPAGGQLQPGREEHKTRGILHRSSSSSSSSSEDDGMGGRRKKGIKEKIKDKLPGARKQTYGQPAAPAGMTGTGATGGPYYVQPAPAGTGAHGTTATTGTYGQPAPAGMTGTGAHGTTATGEKKGMKDKIMEKLPGGHKNEQHTMPTAGAYGQPGMTGTGVHGNTAPGGGYGGQPGHAGMIGTGTHGSGTTGGPYDHQGHPGVTGTGAHGTTATGGAYNQQGHAGVTGTGEKKGIMGKIKEKLPGQH